MRRIALSLIALASLVGAASGQELKIGDEIWIPEGTRLTVKSPAKNSFGIFTPFGYSCGAGAGKLVVEEIAEPDVGLQYRGTGDGTITACGDKMLTSVTIGELEVYKNKIAGQRGPK